VDHAVHPLLRKGMAFEHLHRPQLRGLLGSEQLLDQQRRVRHRARAVVGSFVAATLATVALARCTTTDDTTGCVTNADCLPGQVCVTVTGQCVYECTTAADCGLGFECVDHGCIVECVGGELDCPAGMVAVCGTFCIDAYEASRPDATADDAGSDESRAASQPGVLPWSSGRPDLMNQTVAQSACQASGKRLCKGAEWKLVCGNLQGQRYSYGDDYDPTACNGIDTYCYCEPYPGCYDACDADFHVMPTGALEACQTDLGVWDLNGNVWELVSSSDGLDHYRGGAHNCADPEQLHACDYDATWNPAAKGFRCCADGTR
jgi:hypothetical protein